MRQADVCASALPLGTADNAWSHLYSPHNNSHFLLLQCYFPSVANWLQLRSYICICQVMYMNTLSGPAAKSTQYQCPCAGLFMWHLILDEFAQCLGVMATWVWGVLGAKEGIRRKEDCCSATTFSCMQGKDFHPAKCHCGSPVFLW